MYTFLFFLAPQDALELMLETEWVSEWWLAEFTDLTLVIEDADDHDDPAEPDDTDDPDDPDVPDDSEDPDDPDGDDEGQSWNKSYLVERSYIVMKVI